MQTWSGRAFYPLDPRADDIHIEDIAAHLSKLCRYVGATRFFYSVAKHCVLVSHLVPREMALWGLMHDAAEAYTGDLSRPMKLCLRQCKHLPSGKIDGATYYGDITDRIEREIAMRFGLTWPMPPEIKQGDLMAAAIERRDVMGPSTEVHWPDLPEPLPGKWIHTLDWQAAESEFLDRYRQLRTDRA